VQITEAERALLEQSASLLEASERRGTLDSELFSYDLVAGLVASHNVDPSATGLYLLSFLPSDRTLSLLEEQSGDTPKNIARFLIAQHSPSEARSLAANYRHLTEAIEDLTGRLVQPGRAVSAPFSRVTIIVHGTWAATSKWWQPGSSFWSYVNGIVGNVYSGPNPFSWSGANKHSERIKAARDLVAWAKVHPATELDVIAHSHGGNVCHVAMGLGLKVRKLVTLGTPIRLEYLPHIRSAGVIHNIFSTADLVQTPSGTFPNRRSEGRTLGDSAKIVNHWAFDDGSGNRPGHGDLHESKTWVASNLEAILR
jgi:pimeloyl-ACP methyl ester carboxylesterase